MPYYYYWEPQSQQWLPNKELTKLLKPYYPPPKQHGKRTMFNKKPVKTV